MCFKPLKIFDSLSNSLTDSKDVDEHQRVGRQSRPRCVWCAARPMWREQHADGGEAGLSPSYGESALSSTLQKLNHIKSY